VNVIIEAGELYSFRKEELLWWCVRALASQVDNHENRIGELERQIKKPQIINVAVNNGLYSNLLK
jgi:hypothetical protein